MKKIYVLFLMISVTVVFCLITSINGSETKPANAVPELKKKVIIIDPGHGGFDGGAVAFNGTPEKNINLQISLKLRDYLAFFGYDTVLTRDTDISLEDEGTETIRQKKSSDIHNRLALFNSVDNSILISVHQNFYSEEKYSGSQMFYSPNNEDKSSVLAQDIQNSIVCNVQKDNKREIKKCDSSVYLIYNSQKPAVLAECGFISNREESQKLQTDEYQNKIALSVALGIIDYYSEN